MAEQSEGISQKFLSETNDVLRALSNLQKRTAILESKPDRKIDVDTKVAYQLQRIEAELQRYLKPKTSKDQIQAIETLSLIIQRHKQVLLQRDLNKDMFALVDALDGLINPGDYPQQSTQAILDRTI